MADGDQVLVWKEIEYSQLSEATKQNLVLEVNLLRELRHDSIVRYYDRIVDKTRSTLYIIMEYCEAGDLASYIRKMKTSQYVMELPLFHVTWCSGLL